MQKSMKLMFYLKHLVLMATANKIRLVLTSIGIFIAVFLFSTGLIIVNSYYSGCLRIVEDMAVNTAVISSNKTTDKATQDLFSLTPMQPSTSLVVDEKQSILTTQLSESQYLTVMATVHGVSDVNKTVPVITDEGDLLLTKTKLLKGRLISQTDIQSKNQVVVIDSFTESLLFPDGDSIGNVITLGAGVNGATAASNVDTTQCHLEVVGVVESSYLAYTHKMLLRKELTQNDNNIFVNTSIYCPSTTVNELYPDVSSEKYYLYSFDDQKSYDSFRSSVVSLSQISERENTSYTVNTRESYIEKIEQDLKYTKSLLNIIMLILCLISGISIMSIMFFSIKERIPEIGIRKAFGASKTDIVFQFVFEMVFVALIVSVLSVCISFYFCKLIEGFLTSKLFMIFTVSVSNYQLILPVFIGVLETMLFSIFPSLYAAKIKVTDSLRFE